VRQALLKPDSKITEVAETIEKELPDEVKVWI